jgi:hypothetical protein
MIGSAGSMGVKSHSGLLALIKRRVKAARRRIVRMVVNKNEPRGVPSTAIEVVKKRATGRVFTSRDKSAIYIG